MSAIQYAAELLVKRALEQDPDLPKDALWNVSSGGKAVMALTFIVCAVIIVAVRYTLWNVVATLSFIEKDQPGTALPLDPPAYSEDAEIAAAPQIAITSKIRRTIAHLQSVGGFKARWRGVGCYLCYQFAFATISGVLTGALRTATFGKLLFLDQLLASMVVAMGLAPWSTTWTHIVISEPSPLRWTRRIPAYTWTIQNVWRAVAVHELASRLTMIVPSAMVIGLGLDNPNEHHPGAVLGKAIAVLVVTAILAITIVLPATVTLTRVQASMLPEENETIVSFDRSFGGLVEPSIVGGAGALGFVDAWKTFDKQARTRVVKLCVKLVLIEVALDLVAGGILAGEFAAYSQKM